MDYTKFTDEQLTKLLVGGDEWLESVGMSSVGIRGEQLARAALLTEQITGQPQLRTSKPISNRAQLLNGAREAVDGDRNAQYGDPIQDFRRTAAFWSTYLNDRFGLNDAGGFTIDLAPHDVAVLMSLLKLSRITWSPEKQDSWLDLAGYAACGWDCVVREQEAQAQYAELIEQYSITVDVQLVDGEDQA